MLLRKVCNGDIIELGRFAFNNKPKVGDYIYCVEESCAFNTHGRQGQRVGRIIGKSSLIERINRIRCAWWHWVHRDKMGRWNLIKTLFTSTYTVEMQIDKM